MCKINLINFEHIKKNHFPSHNKTKKSVFMIGIEVLEDEIRTLFDFVNEKGNLLKNKKRGYQMPLWEPISENVNDEVIGWDQNGNFTNILTIVVKFTDDEGTVDVISAYPGKPTGA